MSDGLPLLTPDQVSQRLRSAIVKDAVIRLMVGLRALRDLGWSEDDVFDKLEQLYDQVAAETPPRKKQSA